jgi:signal transduction histidine kinase
MVGHVSPEAMRGGPIACVLEGDTIEIDVDARELRVMLEQEEIDKRLADWVAPPPRYGQGVFARYATMVRSASEGAVTTPDEAAVAKRTADLTVQLEEQRSITELLERVAVASNEAVDPSQALQTCLDAICTNTGWPIGHVYLVSDHDPTVLVPTNIWHLEDAARLQPFVDITCDTKQRRGEGLPGRVLEAGQALWIEDITVHGDFPRAAVSRAVGLKAGFGLPVMIEDEVVGVMEFFIPEVMPRDDELLRVGTHIGTQLGRVVERKRIEEGLRALDIARAEFVANAAHELRTPLTTIMGVVEILTNPRSSPSAEQQTDALELLRRQGKRVNALITNLLDYSRIEVQGSDLQLEDVDVATAVGQATRAAPPPEGVTVDSAVPAGLAIRADPVRIEQVLVNLLTNAYRYGGPRIKISAVADRGDVLLSVNDDGSGIEPDLAASLFDPFTRGSRTKAIIGSGLGLAIVKRLVESFGGEVWCENLAPNGTSFKIRLPARL